MGTLQIPSAPLSAIKLTIRYGSEVRRSKFGSIEEAVAAMRTEADAIRADGGLPQVSAFRTYEPSARVHARLEISRLTADFADVHARLAHAAADAMTALRGYVNDQNTANAWMDVLGVPAS